jgi:hypothetical protein
LPALVLLRKPLSGLAKRRKQPERYVSFALKLVGNLYKILGKLLKIVYKNIMDINWLEGGPYYEVSFITLNKYSNEIELNDLINNLNKLNYKIEIYENDLENKIKQFCNKNNVDISLNIFINICGNERSKIYIEYFSDEIIQINFCFLGENINKGKMDRLKQLLNDLMRLYNGIVGIIGCETDCGMVLFETREPYPHKDYSIKKLKHYTNEDIENDYEWFNGVEEIIWNKNNGVRANDT